MVIEVFFDENGAVDDSIAKHVCVKRPDSRRKRPNIAISNIPNPIPTNIAVSLWAALERFNLGASCWCRRLAIADFLHSRLA